MDTKRDDIRTRALADLRRFEVVMEGHFDYGNGYHGRLYLNPHQLFRYPSTIWRVAQDLIDVLLRRLDDPTAPGGLSLPSPAFGSDDLAMPGFPLEDDALILTEAMPEADAADMELADWLASARVLAVVARPSAPRYDVVIHRQPADRYLPARKHPRPGQTCKVHTAPP